MLYNKDEKSVQTMEHCFKCPKWDEKQKRCKGLGVICFEYDEKTKTAIDPITKLPIQL